ncbi:Clavaminate synthase-like protein [Xylona heveae TC161]|uniref:Clavaminate synthase-like protein n=1 Tax=Xylona heveae (strain CBS 132557 / TC161) TaxID=1328760 RepID=A0A165FGK1_XYLHT|nr:Clavaminate synthase-like protein [Xylona heveae TC161]KZF20952.1 Clavaminate synthase-like protein [Xylona heveae TC161]
MTINDYWETRNAPYQREMQVVEGSGQPTIQFPVVIAPKKQTDKQTVLEEISRLAAQEKSNEPSFIRKLLDANGGAINFKGLPLKSVEDFSDFLSALAGKGKQAWVPHVHVGMEVLRRPLAKNVMTTNEGPPSHFIGWHNEYAVSPVHPGYLVLYCQVPPGAGGETNIVSSLALYDRLKKTVPEFVDKCGKKGLVYQIPHTSAQVGGIVGGNGLYKENAFGPLNGDISKMTDADKRRGVESRIIDLAKRGGWSPEAAKNESLPDWQRRGFDWSWAENGDLEVVHRVPGVRLHPTLKIGSIFNAMSTRYTNAKVNNTWEPPFKFKTGTEEEGIAVPPHFAGVEKDEVIPKEWLEEMDKYQHALGSDVTWEVGDVLVIDNFAVQHARWAWEGDRKIRASFWDEPGIIGEPLTSAA